MSPNANFNLLSGYDDRQSHEVTILGDFAASPPSTAKYQNVRGKAEISIELNS